MPERRGSHSYRDADVRPGATYHYIVTAWDGAERVGDSWEIAVTVQ